jgi:hypothetical protein
VQFSFEFVRIGHAMALGRPCYPCRGAWIGCRKARIRSGLQFDGSFLAGCCRETTEVP